MISQVWESPAFRVNPNSVPDLTPLLPASSLGTHHAPAILTQPGLMILPTHAVYHLSVRNVFFPYLPGKFLLVLQKLYSSII